MERFKDRLLHLSKSTAKKDQDGESRGSPNEPKQTNIVIRPVSTDEPEPTTKAIARDISNESLYDQIKKKYMASNQSLESLNLGQSLESASLASSTTKLQINSDIDSKMR